MTAGWVADRRGQSEEAVGDALVAAYDAVFSGGRVRRAWRFGASRSTPLLDNAAPLANVLALSKREC